MRGFRLPTCVLLLFAANTVTACSGDSSPKKNGDATSACQDLAAARCQKRAACTDAVQTTGVDVLRTYGDAGTCLEREALSCNAAAAAPGSGFDPAQIRSCISALAAQDCAEYIGSGVPPACLPKGTRDSGEPCALNAQCSSGFCAGVRSAECGTCANPPTVGSDCSNSTCGTNLSCFTNDNVCRAVGGPGDACGSLGQACRNGLNCAGPTGAATCEPGAAEVGSSCGTDTPGCNSALGLYCTAVAESCQAIRYVDDGMPCGTLEDLSRVDCLAGACYGDVGVTAGTQGTCKRAGDEGDACDSLLGPQCMIPGRCVTTTGTSGVCVIPRGSSCG